MESAANASEPVLVIASTGLMSDHLSGTRPAIARSPEPSPGIAGKAALDVVTLLGSHGPARAIRPLVSALLQGLHRRGIPAGIGPGSSMPVRGNPGSRRTGVLLRDHPPVPGQRCAAGTGRQPGVLPGRLALRMQGYGILMPDAAHKRTAFTARARRHLLCNTHLSWLACRLMTNDAPAEKDYLFFEENDVVIYMSDNGAMFGSITLQGVSFSNLDASQFRDIETLKLLTSQVARGPTPGDVSYFGMNLDGISGDDVLTGGGKNDIIYGHGGEDTLRGKAGNDFIEGGEGADTINGDGCHHHIDGRGGRRSLGWGLLVLNAASWGV